MENIFVEFLPPWVETGIQPTFYDKESGTVLQQTARMYARVNMLIRMFNKLSKQTKDEVERFDTLYNYVHDYFDNLDVQEEINHKIDEMVEDGTLQELINNYLQPNIEWTFDTVADMKNSTNLFAGSYARTIGYSTINDCGGGLYKITDETLTADEGSIISLSDGLFAKLIYGSEINVAQFGIDSNSTSNLANLITFINANNVNKVIFNPINYSIDETMVINTGDIILEGNNCNITLGSSAGWKSIFNILAPNTIVENFNIYGNPDVQDQWDIAEYSDVCDRRVFTITGKNATVKNVNIYNVWGVGLRFYDYTNVLIENCVMDKIGGGFYHTDSHGVNDNFGDAIYLGGHNGIANVSINNVYCNGYVDEDNTGKGSRGGIVLENLDAYTIENTNVFINNSTFLHFNRFVHEESYSVNTNIEVNNSIVLQDASISASHCPIKFNKCDITFTDKTYNGSVGFSGFIGTFTDCSINLDNAVIEGSLAQGTYTVHTYIRCNINNITSSHSLVVNGVIHCYNTIFNFTSTFSSYILYNSSTSTFNECVFNTTKTDAIHNLSQGGTKLNLTNCVCNNVIPYYGGKNTTNKFIGSIAPSETVMRDPAKLGMFTVTISGSIVSDPNICGVLDATDKVNLLTTCKTAWIDNSSAPYMPTDIDFVLKRNSRFVIVWIGNGAGADSFYENTFDQGYYSVCTTDTSKNITFGTVTTMGTHGTTNELSFDDATHIITPANSNVKRLNYYVLPYEYLSALRRVTL